MDEFNETYRRGDCSNIYSLDHYRRQKMLETLEECEDAESKKKSLRLVQNAKGEGKVLEFKPRRDSNDDPGKILN